MAQITPRFKKPLSPAQAQHLKGLIEQLTESLEDIKKGRVKSWKGLN